MSRDSIQADVLEADQEAVENHGTPERGQYGFDAGIMQDEGAVNRNRAVVSRFFSELAGKGHEVKAADQATAQLLEEEDVVETGAVELNYQHLEGRVVEMEYQDESYFVVMEYANDGHGTDRLGGILDDEHSVPQSFGIEYDRERALNMADELTATARTQDFNQYPAV